MSDWKRCKLSLGDTLKHALQTISDSPIQIGLVVDEKDRLIGIITDGDIRRELLRGVTLEENLLSIVNCHPVIGKYGTGKRELLNLMRMRKIHNLPLVDEENRVRDLLSVSDFVFSQQRSNLVVLMAGGLGTRLRPLTENCPKPLLKVGSKAILETILDSFIESGFHRFYFAVNYKSQMIEDYFGDGSRFGVEIGYLREKERMGTAGALYLLPESVEEPLLVMNGDLLTKVDFGAMLDNHITSNAQATMAVRKVAYQVPYGVIEFDGDSISEIREKPIYEYYANAGIYVLSPQAVARIDRKGFFDMPDLFKKIMEDCGKVNGYLIRDYWLDIGQMEDFKRAQEEYGEIFGC